MDDIFSTVFEVEKMYIGALEEKERVFKEHNEIMKKVLERSSSGDSEEINNLMEEQEQVSRSYNREPGS